MQRRGFSLFEMIFTIAIIAVLALMSAPIFSHFIHQSKLELATDQLKSELNYARSAAIKTHDEAVLCPSKDLLNCEHDWSGQLMVFDPKNSKLLKIYPPIENFQLRWQGNLAKNDELIFQNNGMTKGQNGSFYLCAKDATQFAGKRLILNFSGRVRVEDQNCL